MPIVLVFCVIMCCLFIFAGIMCLRAKEPGYAIDNFMWSCVFAAAAIFTVLGGR